MRRPNLSVGLVVPTINRATNLIKRVQCWLQMWVTRQERCKTPPTNQVWLIISEFPATLNFGLGEEAAGLKCWKILYMKSFEIHCKMFLIVAFSWMIPHAVPWNWMLKEDKNCFPGRRWLCRIHYHTWPSRELDLCWPPSHGKTLQATSAPMARSSHPTTAPPSWCLQITSLHETLLLR